jgi:hypothetical protein
MEEGRQFMSNSLSIICKSLKPFFSTFKDKLKIVT